MPGPRARRRAGAGLLLSLAVLAGGCTSVVHGRAAPAGDVVTDVAPDDFPVGLAGDGEVDRLARNALADVVDYWEQTFPAVYGGEFTDLAGGYWSVDPDTTSDDDLPRSFCADVDDVDAASALYCSATDAVAYNVESLRVSAAEIGPLVVGSTMAHEVGHAVQYRSGTAARASSLVLETQAECFAGAWARWVADGSARHTVVHEAELDRYLRGYRFFADPVGTDPDAPDAHGSAFDQIAAFQVGWAEGAAGCRDEVDDDRLYTGRAEVDGPPGQASPARALAAAEGRLTAFWTAVTTARLPDSGPFQGAAVLPAVAGTGSRPPCDRRPDRLRLTWCGQQVHVDVDAVLSPAVREFGDFAGTALVAVPYALAVRAQLGLPAEGAAATAAAACSTGWMTAVLLTGGLDGADAALAPGDVDEAALALLAAADDPRTLAPSGLSGHELLDAFRRGFEDGGAACAG